MRGDLGITYDEDVLRLMDIFRGHGSSPAGGVVMTRFANQPAAGASVKRLDSLGIKSYLHYPIAGLSLRYVRASSATEGYGKNEYRGDHAPAWWW